MKEIIKIILGFAIAVFLFSSCNEEANLPVPDGTVKGTMITLHLNENSDGNINVFDFGDVQLALDIAVIEGDYSNVELMFSLNNDFTKQYKLADVTTLPSTINFDVLDIVAACDIIADTTEIVPGDIYTFYINFIGADGTQYYGYHPETGKITQSPDQRSIPEQNFDVGFLAACPFIPSNFEGLYNVVETASDGTVVNYQSYVYINPENPENGLICTDIWWPGDATYPCEVTLTIDLATYEVLGEDQIIWGGDAYGLGRIGISDFESGIANTCDFSFSFGGTPDLPDTGYWWGVTVLWEFTPATKNEKTVVKTKSNELCN